MKIIDFNTIKSLNIAPADCLEWVKSSFKLKYESVLPAKTSIKLPDNIFFNTMPGYIPGLARFGVKEVCRYPVRKPSLSGELLLYDTRQGNLLALMDATWITAMRTGAVAALTVNLLKKSNAANYAFIGLGNTARATLLCLLESNPTATFNISLLQYKEQENVFIECFNKYSNARFNIVSSVESLVSNADVLISCITSADGLIAGDDRLYKKGMLLIPVHTRGFQNCDLFFDKVFADDKSHVENFRNFNQFKAFDELSNVILGNSRGRTSDDERILAYNIGIALHDIYFASKIYDRISAKAIPEYSLETPENKFWL